MSDMLRPQIIQNPKPLNWWHKDIKEFYDSKGFGYTESAKSFFMALTSDQSRTAWQQLSRSVTDPRGLTPIFIAALGAWGYVYSAGKYNELKTSKERDTHALDLKNKFIKVAKDVLNLDRSYKNNIGYFESHDHNLGKLSNEIKNISNLIHPPKLHPDMNEKQSRLRGAVHLARSLNQAIIMTTGKHIYQANSGLISAVFDDKDGEFTPEKIREWCKPGKNRT